MRVLHVVKTSDGAFFAAWQSAELIRLGIEVHVAVPSRTGRSVGEWISGGAHIHVVPTDLPVRSPWRAQEIRRGIRALVADIRPDLIHSHFVGTTIMLRLALGNTDTPPRIFQVPGPLHLEHRAFRTLDLVTARHNDYWIASSQCTSAHYLAAGVSADRVFMSYYGWPYWRYATARTNILRRQLGISDDAFVVGNMNWMYRPKYFLGQRVGLKCHEDVIDALAIAIRECPAVVGVLVGGAWQNAQGYEARLKQRAWRAAGDRIRMPGSLPIDFVSRCWPDFDCVVHVPLSENCGGVMEPLLAGVPTIGGNVGGIPELVIDGVTGRLVPIRQPVALAKAILDVRNNKGRHQQMAAEGQRRTRALADVRRTASEVAEIYRHILNPATPRPPEYAVPCTWTAGPVSETSTATELRTT